ncbi:hypothetical protein NSA23_00720 [Anaerosalibacter massiliensis]|uniref:Uncharacterized protein n=1 Tax=Anaerosalibacter massiliensis TaxID=1347392 RepID=A0A9X2MG70_9FIRM|nr:hypothetical protein [Anaerosalibacter massiliensis]MCR2042627.1 hypothetical protein [Anaerosalibacter massiliensis]
MSFTEFVLDIIRLVDKGYKESKEDVKQAIEKENIVQYIVNKYSDEIEVIESPILEKRIKEINQKYWGALGYIKDDNINDGLLYLIDTSVKILGE